MTDAFVAAAAVVIRAGIAFGLAGFGFVMVSMPPLPLYPPHTAVTTGIPLSVLTGGMILPGAGREGLPAWR